MGGTIRESARVGKSGRVQNELKNVLNDSRHANSRKGFVFYKKARRKGLIIPAGGVWDNIIGLEPRGREQTVGVLDDKKLNGARASNSPSGTAQERA